MLSLYPTRALLPQHAACLSQVMYRLTGHISMCRRNQQIPTKAHREHQKVKASRSSSHGKWSALILYSAFLLYWCPRHFYNCFLFIHLHTQMREAAVQGASQTNGRKLGFSVFHCLYLEDRHQRKEGKTGYSNVESKIIV